MAKLVLNTLDFNSIGKIINLTNAVNDQDPVTLAQLKSAIEGLAQKDNVRVASVANINIASPGASINGIAMAVNDRVLLKDQTTSSQNGIYIWNGAAVAMTRSLDTSTADELKSALVPVDEGTHAGQTWRQTAVNFILGTDPVLWVQFGVGASQATETLAGIMELATQAETDAGTDDTRAVTPLKLKTASWIPKGASLVIGDGSATQFDLTHNFNTRKVQVTVQQNASPWGDIIADVQRPDVNTVRVIFGAAPAANAYIVTVLKVEA